jgi:hypothetical protein
MSNGNIKLKHKIRDEFRTVEGQIKYYEEGLKRLREKDPETVYHCPKCNRDVLKYQYKLAEQGMCNDCYQDKIDEDMQKTAEVIIGAKIVDVEIELSDCMWMHNSYHKPHIKKMAVKLPNGKIVILNEEEEAPSLCF